MSKKKTNEEFYEQSLSFNSEIAKKTKDIDSSVTDEYNDHSILKLICITYWVGIFTPICDNQLRQRYGYRIVYVDTMAGSGITSTKRAGDCFAGSCLSTVYVARKQGFPFDKVIAVEINKTKAETLNKRLHALFPSDKSIEIYNEDIIDVADRIANKLKNQTVSYIVIDPQGLRGITWKALKPLLSCKGDAMLTWFEAEAWRVRGPAVTDVEHRAQLSDIERLNELFGSGWRNASSAEELTLTLINRVLSECNKTAYGIVKIPRKKGYFMMILFTGEYRNAKKLAMQWEMNVQKRIQSAYGKDISSLLEVSSGRAKTLFDDY